MSTATIEINEPSKPAPRNTCAIIKVATAKATPTP